MLIYRSAGIPAVLLCVAACSAGDADRVGPDVSSLTASEYRAVAPASISVSPDTVTIAIGKSAQLVSVLRDLRGHRVAFAMGVRTSWSSSDTTVASVSPVLGTVEGLKDGVARITVTAGTVNGSATAIVGKGAPVAIVPPTPTLSSVSLSPATVTLTAGAAEQFNLTAKWSDGSANLPAVTYTTTGGAVTSGGLYTAGATPGSYRVIAIQQGGQLADTAVVNVTAPANPPPLWSADVETGDLTQWSDNVGNKYYQPVCGGQFTTGNEAITVPSTDHARSGRWSAKMTIGGNDTAVSPNGTRMMRWCEIQENRELYYSVWYYIPQKLTISPNGWTNLFQFKSTYDASGASDPFFYLDLRNAPTGEMRFMLTWYTGLKIEGPSPGLSGYRTWKTTQDIPVGKWFHVQARYVCAGDFTGAIQVWQDGVEIFRLEGVRTRYPTGRCVWSANNYGTGISPSPATIYIDDAAISLFKINQ